MGGGIGTLTMIAWATHISIGDNPNPPADQRAPITWRTEGDRTIGSARVWAEPGDHYLFRFFHSPTGLSDIHMAIPHGPFTVTHGQWITVDPIENLDPLQAHMAAVAH